MDGLLHSVLIDYWPYFYIIFSCLVVFVVASLIYPIWRSSTFNSEKNETNHDEAEKVIEKPTANEISAEPSQRAKANKTEEINNKKSYADFLIDRPFAIINQSKKEDEATFNLRNCLRYRLRITALNLETNTEKKTNSITNNFESDLVSSLRALSLNSPSSDDSLLTAGTKQSTNSRVDSLYDTLLQLIDEFDATGIAEVFRLLLERRCAIPLFLPQTKKHFLALSRHINLPGIDNTCLGEDKSLSRVVVVSCRPRNESKTCDILKSIFHIDSIHSHDVTEGKVSSEIVLAEIGCGCILLKNQPEESGSHKIQNVLVVHVIGDFRPLWSFLRRFADCFLIEDSTVESESFFSSFMTEEKQREIDLEDALLGVERKESIGCIWKPSYGKAIHEVKIINGFLHYHIEDQLSYHVIQSCVVKCMEKVFDQTNLKRLKLCEIPILETEEYGSLECVSPTEIESRIAESVSNLLENVKKNEFLLQKNFMQQAKHEEAKIEYRLNEEKVREEDKQIKKIRDLRRADTDKVQKNLLLQLFLNFLENEDSCSRVFSIRVLEKELVKRGEQELAPLLENISSLTSSYFDKLVDNAIAETDLDSLRKDLRLAKTNLVECALNIEHFWRELSHLFTDMEPERRSEIIKKIPRLAAQHLMDGFSLELLDGDSNMIRLDWVKEVLFQLEQLMLKGKRIFVLSVMGVQSSGKSTLLNTMFGIRMRTSVGQCTRGVNMQLLAVEDRPEYDYILLLDTEGTRSPEYHGLPGSEKRDNQMATLSILLSDVSIVVIPGENDAAVKEILPIVLMAYQGSKLAEDNGGQLSTRMFFVYNRIDTSQGNKLNSIIQTLGTSLHTAFKDVRMSTGNLTSESPFANFKLVTSDSSSSDVCILGNVKKQSEPPGDVPDEAYGKGVMQFREHIHRRVTNVECGKIWKSRSIIEFSNYIKNVWTCICSANFIFSFSTIMEQIAFNKLESQYKIIERKLAETYENSFENVKDEMNKLVEKNYTSSCSTSMRGPDGQRIQESNGHLLTPFDSFLVKLRDELSPIEQVLDREVSETASKISEGKWQLLFEQIWNNTKNSQTLNWELNLKNAYNRLFYYENRVENYKKKMRTAINDFFKSSTDSNVSNWTKDEKNEKFEEMFTKTVDDAEKEFPKRDVPGEIKVVYQNSPVIARRQILINWADESSHFLIGGIIPIESKTPRYKQIFKELNLKRKLENFFLSGNEKEKTKSLKICFKSVWDTVHRISTGKLCYDDSIISNVIRDVDSILIKHNLTDFSVVLQMHQYGMTLIVDLMQKIQTKWERENSVPAKLESDKEILRQYFMMVSQGVAKTILFAKTMAATLKKNILPAFEKQMVHKIFLRIRNERWLHHDARFMQKHMDLHLINLLEEEKLNEALYNIRNPKTLYEDVLHRLIAEKVTNVDDEWEEFKTILGYAIEKAAAFQVDKGRAQTFVDQLRKEFLEGYLKSEILGSSFRIDCSGEYEDCDEEERKEFYDACSKKLKEVLDKSEFLEFQGNYAKELSPKVVQYMIALNDKAALPRCDVSCRNCQSLCIEPANHDTQLRPHDAIHQPAGVAGISRHPSDRLEYSTCSQCFEQDRGFYLNGDYTTLYKYRDYDKVFPEWKNPKLQEELPVREYILATYNDEIAEKYNKKPADDIPASYFRDLKSIKKQLENDIQIGSGDTNNQSE